MTKAHSTIAPGAISLAAIALAATATPALAQYGAPPPVQPPRIAATPAPSPSASTSADPAAKPSKQAIKALAELQKAFAGKDPAIIATALASANAAARTNDDRYIIAQLRVKAALDAKDNAATASAIQAIDQSGFLSPARVAQLYLAMGGTYYDAKQFDAAAAQLDRGLALDPANEALLTNLAETRFAQNQMTESVNLLQRLIQRRTASGQKVDEAIYRRAVGIAYSAKMPVAISLGRQWIAAYPSADSWRNGLAIYQNYNKPGVEPVLGLLRLMRATGALTGNADYSLYSSAAAEQGNYNEAQAVIDEGLAKGVVSATSPVIKDIIAGLKSKPKASAADLATATRESSTAKAYLRIGDRYLGQSNYAKAAELYRMALVKPDADSSLLQFHLGMALARQGDKAGARDAFGKVSGALAPIAEYWKLYVDHMA